MKGMADKHGRLRPKDAAKFIGVPEGTLYSMLSRKQIPHVRLNKRIVLFEIDELEKWMDAHRVPAIRNGRNRLREYRISRGLTEQELEQLAGVPLAVIKAAEQGIRLLSPDEAQSFATALGIQTADLTNTSRSEGA